MMTSSSNDDVISFGTGMQCVILQGSINYPKWFRSIDNVLAMKRLAGVALGDSPMPNITSALDPTSEELAALNEWLADDRAAAGYINGSLGPVAADSLPKDLREYRSPTKENNFESHSYRLLNHLKNTYSAISPARKYELFRSFFRRDLPEGGDPKEHFAHMVRVFNDLTDANLAFSDEIYAFTLLNSLPSSYNPFKQVVLAQDSMISSQKLISKINEEFETEERRRLELESAKTQALAMLASGKVTLPAKKGGSSSGAPKEKFYGKHHDKYCDNHMARGHATAECKNPEAALKAANKRNGNKSQSKDQSGDNGASNSESANSATSCCSHHHQSSTPNATQPSSAAAHHASAPRFSRDGDFTPGYKEGFFAQVTTPRRMPEGNAASTNSSPSDGSLSSFRPERTSTPDYSGWFTASRFPGISNSMASILAQKAMYFTVSEDTSPESSPDHSVAVRPPGDFSDLQDNDTSESAVDDLIQPGKEDLKPLDPEAVSFEVPGTGKSTEAENKELAVEESLSAIDLPTQPVQLAQPASQLGHSALSAVASPHTFALMALLASSDEFTIDTGATQHMVHDRGLLRNIQTLQEPIDVRIANDLAVPAVAVGDLPINERIVLKDVLLVPDFARNLLSVGEWTKDGKTAWLFSSNRAFLMSTADYSVLLEVSKREGLFILEPTAGRRQAPVSLVATTDTLLHWHRCLAHLNPQDVIALGKEGRLGDSTLWSKIAQTERDVFQCQACIQGKGRRLPSPPSTVRAAEPNGVVHVDLFGPVNPQSIGKKEYMMTLYDDYSCKITVELLHKKSDSAPGIVNYVHRVERQLGKPVKVIRADGGGEFDNKWLREKLSEMGVELVIAPPDAHTQQGRVERAHLTILNVVRTLLVDSKLPGKFWGEAAIYAAYARNRSPAGPRHEIPEDIWRGTAVPLTHMRPFGCHLYVRDHKQNNKLKPRYVHGRLMSYVEGTSNFRVLLDSGAIVVSRDVVFPKRRRDGQFDPKEQPQELEKMEFHEDGGRWVDTPAEHYWIDLEEGTQGDSHDSETSKSYWSQQPVEQSLRSTSHPLFDPMPLEPPPEDGAVLLTQRIEPPQPKRNPVRTARLPPSERPQPKPQPTTVPSEHKGYHYVVDTETDSGPRTEPSNDDSQGLSTQVQEAQDLPAEPDHEPATGGLDDGATCLLAYALTATGIPQSYEEARRSPQWPMWQEAMNKELSKMDKYRVWEVVDERPGMRLLDGRWVYSMKIDTETGHPTTPKARWVARGFRQVKGLDYNELHASVAHKDSLRAFLALVNYLDLECDQVDITAAFLNGKIEEEIYVRPPEGSGISSGQVCKLKSTLYGLKQSPRCFNEALDFYLRSEGLNPTRADKCIYHRKIGTTRLMIALHVDDQLVAGNSRPDMDRFKVRLNARFECTDGGPVSFFLGIAISRDRAARKLWMSQEHYLTAVLERFGMQDCKGANTPFPANFKATKATDDEHDKVKDADYKAMVGSILYAATITRPDLAEAGGVLGQHTSKWAGRHVYAAKHVLRYINVMAGRLALRLRPTGYVSLSCSIR